MSLAHGHQDRKYNPKNKAEVRKIKDYINEKLAEKDKEFAEDKEKYKRGRTATDRSVKPWWMRR